MVKTTDRNILFLSVGGIALLFFVAGVLLSNIFNLAACPLCILQRMIYLLLGIGGMAAWTLARASVIKRYAASALALIAICGAFVAGYQSYIQRTPIAASCTADSPWWENLVYWAGEQFPALFLSSGLCTDPGFRLLGLSIAEYSLSAFTALAVLMLLSLKANK